MGVFLHNTVFRFKLEFLEETTHSSNIQEKQQVKLCIRMRLRMKNVSEEEKTTNVQKKCNQADKISISLIVGRRNSDKSMDDIKSSTTRRTEQENQNKDGGALEGKFCVGYDHQERRSAIKCAGQHDTLNSPHWQGVFPLVCFVRLQKLVAFHAGRKLCSPCPSITFTAQSRSRNSMRFLIEPFNSVASFSSFCACNSRTYMSHGSSFNQILSRYKVKTGSYDQYEAITTGTKLRKIKHQTLFCSHKKKPRPSSKVDHNAVQFQIFIHCKEHG